MIEATDRRKVLSDGLMFQVVAIRKWFIKHYGVPDGPLPGMPKHKESKPIMEAIRRSPLELDNSRSYSGDLFTLAKSKLKSLPKAG